MTSRPTPRTIDKAELARIVDRLRELGRAVVGPTVAQGAVVLDEIRSPSDLPIGWTEDQERGTYRLRRSDDATVFGFTVGPHSWKKYLFPPRLTLYTIEAADDGFRVRGETADVPAYAFLGVRPCDLKAIEVQDRTFGAAPYPDPHYLARREAAFVIVVNCAKAAPTCFCSSMGTGPRSEGGYDLALTELTDRFLVEIGSDRGREVLDAVVSRPATDGEVAAALEVSRGTERSMKRRLDTSDLPNLLYENLDHPRWDDVAARCLSCTNCTMVCPTCFCHSVEDVPDLEGTSSDRVRVWDSCFDPEFGHVAGGNTRPEIRARYRQWLTHKLASWIDQFGVSGCVGCGRCVTWCPVGIDLTEEVAAIRGEAVP